MGYGRIGLDDKRKLRIEKMDKIKHADILEDLYLQYEDMEKALERYLEIFNLKIVLDN